MQYRSRVRGAPRPTLRSSEDSGGLVFREGWNSQGVILLRIEDVPVADRLVRLQPVWAVIKSNLQGHLVVVTGKRLRMRPLTAP